MRYLQQLRLRLKVSKETCGQSVLANGLKDGWNLGLYRDQRLGLSVTATRAKFHPRR